MTDPGVLIGLAAGTGIWIAMQRAKSSPERLAREREAQARIRCPHCGEVGHVTKTLVQRKQGVSGGKATGALLTGGVSMVFTGLSRKQQMSHLRCGNCLMEWDVA